MPPKHSLVFLTYNRSDLIQKRVTEVSNSLLDYGDLEIVIVDNGSTDPLTRLTFGQYSYTLDQALWKVRRLDPNAGFAGGFNQAVAMASGKIVHLISDDVAIWGINATLLRRIDQVLDDDPAAIVCHQIINWPAGWNQFGGELIEYPAGYYLAMWRAAWDRLKGFDERFSPHDYEDVDLGRRIAQDDGLYLLEVADLPLEHAGAGTIGFGPERYEHTIKMRAKFAEKHGLPNIPERP